MDTPTDTCVYQYLSLPKASRLSFRLFTLYPAHDPSALIQGELHPFSWSRSSSGTYVYEEYEALSYAWGDETSVANIEFPDKSHLRIGANLESFLRYRRQRETPVILWIDAICINQDNAEERSTQVQVMGQIYLLASRLSIWLGPPSDDSALAMTALQEVSCEHPYSKLSIPPEQSAAIDHLLNRAWGSRVWIIQEVALGGDVGTKYDQMTVRCGFERIAWKNLVLACARMCVNTLNMRQSFPAVENVLKLDLLPTRGGDEMLGPGEPYPCRLLRQLSEHRNCSASDPKDKIYALLGLWADTIGVEEQIDISQRPAPIVDYERSVEDVYADFATWIVCGMQSLELLRHCHSSSLDSTMAGNLPTWVPDWSQALPYARLPSAETTERAPIPWWSLPVHSGEEDERQVCYYMDDYSLRRKRAEEILRPHQSSGHFIPEWAVDLMDPDGTKGYESLFKELQSRPDVIFVFPDESDRALGNDQEDVWSALKRTQDHNETRLQRQVVSRHFDSRSLLRTHYGAGADTTCRMDITGRKLHVEGMIVDTVHQIFEAFPEDIEKDWTNSAQLMIQIGTCKQAIMSESIDEAPYPSGASRPLAFWKTLFAGQQASDETKVASWLPVVQLDWQRGTPSLTVLQSARLEYAEIRTMTEAFVAYLERKSSDGGTLVHTSFDDNLAQDDIIVDAQWSSSERLDYTRAFEALAREWVKQSYDLYPAHSVFPM